jgi:hypothetical protein
LALALTLLAVVVGLGACGEKDEPTITKPAETVDEAPELPKRWTRLVSRAGGFSVGVPPGWKARNRGGTALLRPKDRLVVVSITADRSAEALGAGLDDYAEETAKRLPGLRNLRLKPAGPFEGARYPGFAVRGTGTAKGGVRERLLVVVMRRPELAAYVALVASNARAPARRERQAKRILRTLTGRPVAEG